VSERHRNPEPGKSILTGSSYRNHDAHGPGKRTLTETLPYRAPARRGQDRVAGKPPQAASAPEPESDDAKTDVKTDVKPDAKTDDRSAPDGG
jgi:hypothetical protein